MIYAKDLAGGAEKESLSMYPVLVKAVSRITVTLSADVKDKDRPSTGPAILTHPVPRNYPPVVLVACRCTPQKVLGDREESSFGSNQCSS